MFLNLSSHPVDDPVVPWSSEQREAAERIGGAVEDCLFPEVDPNASEEDVRRIGSKLVQRVLLRSPKAALVQGEYALAFYLVNALEKGGVRCYVAATRRKVRLEPGPGGQVIKQSLFEFVRFRRYVL